MPDGSCFRVIGSELAQMLGNFQMPFYGGLFSGAIHFFPDKKLPNSCLEEKGPGYQETGQECLGALHSLIKFSKPIPPFAGIIIVIANSHL